MELINTEGSVEDADTLPNMILWRELSSLTLSVLGMGLVGTQALLVALDFPDNISLNIACIYRRWLQGLGYRDTDRTACQ